MSNICPNGRHAQLLCYKNLLSMFGLQIIDALGFRVFFRLLRFPFFSEAQ